MLTYFVSLGPLHPNSNIQCLGFKTNNAMLFAVCVLVRLTLSVVAFVYAHLVPSIVGAVLCALPAIGFLLLSVGVWTRDAGIETRGCPIWWKDLRPFHGLLWAMMALAFLSKKRRHAVATLMAFDTLLGIVAWCSRRWNA